MVVPDDGVEGFTDVLPLELDDIELLRREGRVVQLVPPSPAGS